MTQAFRPRGTRILARLIAFSAFAVCGCASMRMNAPSIDLRPCTDGFAYTDDGWRLGIRHYRPEHPDPRKLPVVLCHGLGLNGTFWTITDAHLPSQLVAHGYEVFVPDLRGSGSSRRVGRIGQVNEIIRQTPLLAIKEAEWTVDDLAMYDVPAILDYVQAATGRDRVNWVGHSLGGMLMFAHLERAAHPERIATFVGMGSTIAQAEVPQRDMLRANHALRTLCRLVSTSRMARPMSVARPPGLGRVDAFYYTSTNVDRRTISRFYGYVLEDLSKGALKQLDPYLARGHFLSADGTIDYVHESKGLTTPTLLIAGEADIMSDIPSTIITYEGIGSPDKTLMRFGKREGQIDDYGHCDLVWSRHAPHEIFPPLIDWLDRRQPGVLASPQHPPQVVPSPQLPSSQSVASPT